MNFSSILLIITGVIIAFGLGQRALDRLRLTDTQAYIAIALIIILGFVPDIPLGRVKVNLGGAVIPFALSVYLFVKADTAKERWRSVLCALTTGAAVWLLMRFLPDEPENQNFDPNWLYGLTAAIIASLFGRSRRAAFIGGVIGTMLASTATAIIVWAQGVPQTLNLGGAGAFDTVVIAGFLGVMLAELIGEIKERVTRGRDKPTRHFKNGEFVEDESR